MNSNYIINNTHTANTTTANNTLHATTATNSLHTTIMDINNDLFLTQDAFAGYLFGASTAATTTPTSSVDEWLADELQQSGLLPLPDFLKQEQHVMDYYLAQPSPALTSSSPTSSGSSVSSPHTSPVSPAGTPPATTVIAPPLFPDISPKKPGFRAIAPAKKQLVPIMPKTDSTNNVKPSGGGLLSSMPLALGSLHPLQQQQQQQQLHHQIAPSSKRKQVDEKENDDIALKRQKNTDAARRSRLKKLVKMESLEKRVIELETDNTKLSTRIAVLESEKSGLEAKDKGLEERIRTLEAQLAEAHKALTSRH